MSKRNSRYGIHKHLKMLLRTIPMRQEAALREAIAARIEADEATGEIFARSGKSPRELLREAANISRKASFDEGMSLVRKLGLIQGHRIYSRGERNQGDRLVLDWDTWDAAFEAMNGVQEPCTSLTEAQEGRTPLNEVHPDALTEVQADALSGVQQYYKDTAIVTAKRTARRAPTGAKLSSAALPPVSAVANATETSATPLPPPVGLQEQQENPELAVQPTGDMWVDPAHIPASHARAVWRDHKLGGVHIVYSALGRKFYGELLRKEYPAEIVRDALIRCAPELARTSARIPGTWEAVVTKWCHILKGDAEAKRAKPAFNGYAKADAPKSFGGWK